MSSTDRYLSQVDDFRIQELEVAHALNTTDAVPAELQQKLIERLRRDTRNVLTRKDERRSRDVYDNSMYVSFVR